MVRKIYSVLVLLSLFFLFLPRFSSAQENVSTGQVSAGMALLSDEMKIAPDYIPGTSGTLPFSGQNHNYSVVFRGNGEAIVTLRVVLTNTKEDGTPLSNVSLRIPKILEPKDLSVYQIIAQRNCGRYDYSIKPSPGGNVVYPCLTYLEPDYYNYYGAGKYQKAKFGFSGDTLDITLPSPLATQKSGSFFVYFRAFGYAKKNLLGAYKFDFETLKVEDQINQLNIGISTDADQFLKGAKGQVDYRFNESSAALKAAPSADAGAVASPMIDRFVQQIGQGTIIKNASNLAGLESYKVNGMYANSRVKLYGSEIFVAILVFLLTVFIIAIIARIILRRQKSVEKSEGKDSVSGGSKNFLISLGASIASSLIAVGYTVIVYMIANAINQSIDYQYQAVVAILLVVISFAVYALIIIAPAIYLGVKKGVGWGIGNFVMTIVWLILFGAVAILVLFVFRGQSYPVISPLLKTTTSRSIAE